MIQERSYTNISRAEIENCERSLKAVEWRADWQLSCHYFVII